MYSPFLVRGRLTVPPPGCDFLEQEQALSALRFRDRA